MSFALGYALYLAALLLLAVAAPGRGLRLYLALLALAVGVGVINVEIEAVVFGLLDTGTALTGAAFNTLTLAVLAAMAVLVTGKWGKDATERAQLRLGPVRVAGVIAAYVICYFVAGMAVYPFVRDFYGDAPIPSLPALLGLQAVRGGIYLLASLPWLWLRPRWAPLVLGVVYALIAGLAPLAFDNPLMPANIRAAHAVEIGVSNFAFGLVLGWLIAARRAP